MRRIKYVLYDGKAYMTEFDGGVGESVRFEFEDIDGAMLKIGKLLVKISHGVAEVSLNELGDGVYTPELIKNEGRFKLDVMLIRAGVIKIASGEEFHAKVLSELLNLKRLLDAISPELVTIKDAVYGKKLF